MRIYKRYSNCIPWLILPTWRSASSTFCCAVCLYPAIFRGYVKSIEENVMNHYETGLLIHRVYVRVGHWSVLYLLGHRHLRSAIHVFPMGALREDGEYLLGGADRAVLLLHGVGVGWLRVHHQLDPPARPRPPHHRPFQLQNLRWYAAIPSARFDFLSPAHFSVYDFLHSGTVDGDADSIRGIPTGKNERTHGGGG